MQITSPMNKVGALLLSCGVLLGSYVRPALADGGSGWSVTVGPHASIAAAGKRIAVDRALGALLKRAEAGSFLPLELKGASGKTWRWLLLREGSRVRKDAGFCGSGHEDRLLLIDVTQSKGKSTDEFLVQSCWKAISMDADQFNELLEAIEIDDEALHFEQSVSNATDSFRQEVGVGVRSGRMTITTRRLSD